MPSRVPLGSGANCPRAQGEDEWPTRGCAKAAAVHLLPAARRCLRPHHERAAAACEGAGGGHGPEPTLACAWALLLSPPLETVFSSSFFKIVYFVAFRSRLGVGGSCKCFFITGHVLMGCSSGGSVAASGLSLATLLGSSGIKPGSRPGAQRLLLRPGLVLERQRREQSTQHLSSGPCQGRVLAPTSIAPAPQQVGARAGSQVAGLRLGKSSRRKKGSKQTEIPCTVNCLRFLPCSPGRAAPLPSPAPFLVKRKGDDETCCFFSCCAYKPFSLLQAGGGDGCPSSSSVADWGWSLEPETSPSPLFSPGRLPACLLPFCLPP